MSSTPVVVRQTSKNCFLPRGLWPAESKGRKPAQGRQDQVGQSRWQGPQETDRMRRWHPQRRAARHFGVQVQAYVVWAEAEALAQQPETTAQHREPVRTPGPPRPPALAPWVFPSRVSLW